MKKAPFIVIDGMDGSGKGTQINLLVDRAMREGRGFYATREPGGAPLSENIRELFKSPLGMGSSARTQFLMMWASRSEWLEKIIIPHLSVGVPVFSDRCDTSTLAYQVYAKKAPELEDEFWRMRQMIFGKYDPTVYIIIDVPAEEAKRRVDADKSREASDFDLAPLDFYRRVRRGFQAFHTELPNQTIMIDGARAPEEIHEEIYGIVRNICIWR